MSVKLKAVFAAASNKNCLAEERIGYARNNKNMDRNQPRINTDVHG